MRNQSLYVACGNLRRALQKLYIEFLRSLCPPGFRVVRVHRGPAPPSHPNCKCVVHQTMRDRATEARQVNIRG